MKGKRYTEEQLEKTPGALVPGSDLGCDDVSQRISQQHLVTTFLERHATWQHNDNVGFHLKNAATLSNQWGPLLTPINPTRSSTPVPGSDTLKVSMLLLMD